MFNENAMKIALPVYLKTKDNNNFTGVFENLIKFSDHFFYLR